MLRRMSQFEFVREVAQNPDILKLIFVEVDPMFQGARTPAAAPTAQSHV